MRPLRFHLLRFLEWLDDLGAARAFARVRRDSALGKRLFDRARRRGAEADAITPPAEWSVRLWDRDHDPRSDTRDRRP